MSHFPIAIELTVWKEFGIDQYEITLDEISTLTYKKTEDVLHAQEISSANSHTLFDIVGNLRVLMGVQKPERKADFSHSYEVVVESAHFFLELNWEDADIQDKGDEAFKAATALVDLVSHLALTHQ